MDADLVQAKKYTLDTLECYVLDGEDIQARAAMMEIVKQMPAPGKVMTLRKQQFKALKRGCVILRLPQELVDACYAAAKEAATAAVRSQIEQEVRAALAQQAPVGAESSAEERNLPHEPPSLPSPDRTQ